MLYLAIVEDCEMQTDVIIELLSVYQAERSIKLEVSSYLSGEELLECLNGGKNFDLMLLDILMPGIDGIDLAKEIRKKDEDVTLLYITATENFAIEAFKVYASNYIVKPVTESNLFPVLDRIIPFAKKENEQYLTFSVPDRTVKLPFSSIVCAELLNRKPCIHMENGEALTGKFLRGNFDDMIEPLLNDKRFLHVHKSYVINLDYAVELNSNSFILQNNMVIPVTKRKFAEAKKRYLDIHTN